MIRNVLTSLGIAATLLLGGCRGREPARGEGEGLERDAAILAARTLGLAYLRSEQLGQAETAFRKIVALAPDQALGYANLGLVQLRQGRYVEAEREIRRAAALDTASDDIALTLAKVYELTGRTAEARRAVDRVLRRSPDDLRALYELVALDPASQETYLRRIVERAPSNVAARLDLVDVLLARGGGGGDAAAAQLEALERQLPELPREANRFFAQALALARAGRASAAAAPATTFHRFMETTAAYQASLQKLRGANGARPGYPILTFNPVITPPAQDARAIAAAIRFSDVTTTVGLLGAPPLPDTATAVALATGDYDGDGSEDVFVGGRLFHNELARATELTTRAGIELRDRAVAAAFGDYDNDGRLDLFVATASGGRLFRNAGDSSFTDVTAAAGLDSVPPATTALFVDLDHDADLDLFLATPAGNRVYRNVNGRFEEMAGAMGLAGSGGSRDAAFGDFDGDGLVDLVVVGSDGRLTLFRNAGQGHFADATAASGLAHAGPPGRAAAIAVGDYDNDGFLDLFVASAGGTAPVLYRNRGDGSFEPDRRSAALEGLRALAARAALFFDFDNDGFLDLVVVGTPTRAGARGVYLFRNDQTGRFLDRSAILPNDLPAARRVVAVDYDRDGDLDLLVMGEDGRPRLLLNDGGNANQYVQVELAALRTGSGKNNRFGIGSTLELRAGKLYQARVVTGRVTHFGLGQRLKADVLRARWPNGVAQTVYYPGTDQDILEQQILKGSCPFLYAWDGAAFRFVTDVMWRSALGMPLGIMASGGGTDIASAPPHASREYMRVPGRALAPRDGRYVLQLTEELWETAYLDQAKLLVVDHPDSVDVYVDEGFVPPAPGPAALRLYAVSRPRPPVAATDERGTDWLPALRARDDHYVAPLTLTRYQGISTLHDLILDFGDLKGLDSVSLFLAGWIYPTDASINIALAQAGKPGVIFPYLEVKDPQGRWRRVAEVGFPSGKDKMVVVDLTGKFLSADHRVRIRTNMEIYWDQAFVAAAGENHANAPSITTLDPMTAEVHYRGFSRLYRKGGRYGPQWAAYEDLSRESPWEPIVGAYTRYGDVLPLVRAPDDMYVIMAPGDETTLSFDAGHVPALRPGWRRDFLLYTDAWLKDSDRNTAMGGTVTPLPFHGMSRYPYGRDEAYPTDAAHTRYLETYITRRVGRYRPLAESSK